MEDREVVWMEQIADLQSSLTRVVEERNAALLQIDELRKALEHELRGSDPCGPDCAGKICQCTGCDKRARTLLRSPEKRKAECPDCGLGVRGKDPLCDKHYRDYLAAHAPPPPTWYMSAWESDEIEKANQDRSYRRRDKMHAEVEWRWAYADAMITYKVDTQRR